jgi:hypothetical protein
LLFFYRLLGECEPRSGHGEKHQPAFGITNSFGQLNAMSGVQAVTRHKTRPQIRSNMKRAERKG